MVKRRPAFHRQLCLLELLSGLRVGEEHRVVFLLSLLSVLFLAATEKSGHCSALPSLLSELSPNFDTLRPGSGQCHQLKKKRTLYLFIFNILGSATTGIASSFLLAMTGGRYSNTGRHCEDEERGRGNLYCFLYPNNI